MAKRGGGSLGAKYIRSNREREQKKNRGRGASSCPMTHLPTACCNVPSRGGRSTPLKSAFHVEVSLAGYLSVCAEQRTAA